MGPTEIRWNNALSTIRNQGITVRENVVCCCRNCIGPEELEISDKEYDTGRWAYTYGSQRSGYVFRTIGEMDYVLVWDDEAGRWQSAYDDEDPVEEVNTPSEGGPAEWIYFNFADVEVAKIIKEAFEEQNFIVEWSGTISKCVKVKPNNL